MHPFIETQKTWLRNDLPAFRSGDTLRVNVLGYFDDQTQGVGVRAGASVGEGGISREAGGLAGA